MDEETSIAWIDMLNLMLQGIVLAVAFALILMNPPQQSKADEVPPGALTVQAFWPDDLDVDVDLWVLAPGDRPVGYSNKDGRFFNLLRDDLGFVNDPSGKNFEVAYSRSLPPGEYVVNVHLYSKRVDAKSIPVKVTVQERRPGAATELLADRDVRLTRLGQEITVVRFRLDDHGNLVPGSINDLPRPLRSAES
jgi:hypothetical protein